MRKRRSPQCRKCHSWRTIRRGSRRGCKRYFCNACRTSFSVDHGRRNTWLWTSYVDGLSLRKLGRLYQLSPAQTYRRVTAEIKKLPDNTRLTADRCDRFCGILVVDGKYVKVRGYPQKIPFIYGVDYLTHDIPVGILARSESEGYFHRFFQKLKAAGYPLKAVVCDDVISALKTALFHYYPDAKVQLCHNHYVENIRQHLNVRTRKEHKRFFAMLYKGVFRQSKEKLAMSFAIRDALRKRAERNLHRQAVMLQLEMRQKELFVHHEIPDCPKDTNLVELFNSHLNARLRATKGFKSFQGAERWLNAYMILRRTKPFTDCDQKFKHLNGKCSLEMTLKDGAKWPKLLGILRSNAHPK